MGKKWTLDDFIARATEKHGGKYEYPVQPYTTSKAKVRIVCKVHGEFEQTASDHLQGKGCRKCSAAVVAESKRKTFGEFVAQATARHKGTYEYPAQVYGGVASQVLIICPVHGKFRQRASDHLQGKGCRKCGREKIAESHKLDLGTVIARATARHNGKYSYPPQAYLGISGPLRVICPEHGEFTQIAGNHLAGARCPTCGNKGRSEKNTANLQNFIAKARERHGDRYEYPDQPYLHHNGYFRIICPDHGEFTQAGKVHLSGSGCPACAVKLAKLKKRKSFSDFVKQAVEKHNGAYAYRAVQDHAWVEVICPTHGAYLQRKNNHLFGHGCSDCGLEKISEDRRFTFEDFKNKATNVHNSAYTYPEQEFSGTRGQIIAVCTKHGEFKQTASNHLSGSGCPKCANQVSAPETEVMAFVLSLGLAAVRGDRKAIPELGRKEFDIYIPSKRIAIEFNGLIWHSEKFNKGKLSLLDKTNIANSLNIQLVHIFDDEWRNKPEIVKARLRAILGVEEKKIFARDTVVGQLDYAAAKEFLEKTHLQGAGPAAKVCLGLYYNNELVAVATFGSARYAGSGWELLRFASVGRVVGGASKLLKRFEEDYAQPGDTITTYADRRWGAGEVYSKIGFKFVGFTDPGYFYTTGTERFSRESFQKHKLADRLTKFDPELTEVENCWNNGLYRVWDCGHAKFEKIVN